MTDVSRKIFEAYHVRKSKKQKAAFRDYLCGELEKAGYSPKVEKKGSSCNVVVGDPERAKLLYTAHYDTCAVLPFPNFITPRNMVFYLLYQLLILIPMFALAFGAEILMLVLWKDAPLWAAMAVTYAVLIFCCWWLMDGPANRHTANDNTSGVLTLIEIALTLPEELRDKVCFVFFDNEEKGLLGSSAFAGMHKEAKKNAFCINFDCVSDGDHIQFYPSKEVKKDAELLRLLEECFPAQGEKKTEVVRSFGFYPSDQARFKKGVGVCALKKKPVIGYYMDRIHTRKDTVLDEKNLELLRMGALTLAEKMD